MDRVTIRDLRNKGGEVIDRVEGGEVLVVTRDGRPVAELHPVRTRGLHRDELLRRWRHMPYVDPEQFRADLDAVINPCIDGSGDPYADLPA